MSEQYAVYEVSGHSGRLVHYRVTEPYHEAARAALVQGIVMREDRAGRLFVVGDYPFTREVSAEEVRAMIERKHAQELALWRSLQ